MASVSVTVNTKDGVITLIAGGRPYQVGPRDPKYGQLKRYLKEKNNEQSIINLLSTPFVEQPKVQKNFNDGRVEVKNGQVFYNGEAVHSAISGPILKCLEFDIPIDGHLKALERLMKNPSNATTLGFFDFAANKNLPFTEDGYILAYKLIRGNWLDKYSGTLLNKPGMRVEMPRNKVNDNRDVLCSHGLHVGAMDYICWYHARNRDENDRVVIVKVDPADCVSVPTDHNFMKMRVSGYWVVEEYKGDLTKLLYTSAGEEHPATQHLDDNDDEGWLDKNENWDSPDKSYKTDEWDEPKYAYFSYDYFINSGVIESLYENNTYKNTFSHKVYCDNGINDMTRKALLEIPEIKSITEEEYNEYFAKLNGPKQVKKENYRHAKRDSSGKFVSNSCQPNKNKCCNNKKQARDSKGRFI